jgi:hypothetical protein
VLPCGCRNSTYRQNIAVGAGIVRTDKTQLTYSFRFPAAGKNFILSNSYGPSLDLDQPAFQWESEALPLGFRAARNEAFDCSAEDRKDWSSFPPPQYNFIA